MKQINLKKNFLAITMMGSALMVNAQSTQPLHFGAGAFPTANWYSDYVGTILSVNSPASIAGDKLYKVSNDGSGDANQWGGIPIPLSNIEVVMAAPDSSANNPLQNGTGTYPSMAGKIALIYRGGNEFSQKAAAAEGADAVACIIVNNIPGGPVAMGAGDYAGQVDIPVFMISEADGDAIRQQIEAGQTVTMSISEWGQNQGYANDLGFVPNGLSISPAYAMPAYDLASTNGDPMALKNMNGAFIANFGSADATNVKLKTTVQFTATGSENATTIMTDSSTAASFPQQDSILALQTNNEY
ncbi:MAG TPA: PA domain-containing protein, partial [Candidatus Babeliaceae bacterium]|nr:PA domain-containing protein [Candidatus Babeliaceae bacterium]